VVRPGRRAVAPPGRPRGPPGPRGGSSPAGRRGPAAFRIGAAGQGLSGALGRVRQPCSSASRPMADPGQEPAAHGGRGSSRSDGPSLGPPAPPSGTSVPERGTGHARQGAGPSPGARGCLAVPPGMEAGAPRHRSLSLAVGLGRPRGLGGWSGLAARRLAAAGAPSAPDAGRDRPLPAAQHRFPGLPGPVRPPGSRSRSSSLRWRRGSWPC
jgi:hypothetical protein